MLDAVMTAATALVCGTISVLVALFIIQKWDPRKENTGMSGWLDHEVQPIIFLFHNEKLVDATPPAKALLALLTGNDSEWQRLVRWISARFPDAAQKIHDTDSLEKVTFLSQNGTGHAQGQLVVKNLGNNRLRLMLTDPGADGAGIIIDALALQAMEEELDLLRRSIDQTPMLVWRQDAKGKIVWANAAYLHHVEERAEGAVAWPLPQLLEMQTGRGANAGTGRRAQLTSGGHIQWYDCHSQRHGDETMMFALPADAAVRAERSLREFVQTLTKTFANLPIGLAIFDRDRHLQLFNPALIDLTGLPTGFLTARPTLFDFLDQLRDTRMVPEPKDYRTWRQQMNNLEAAAATGHHLETWSLPGGQTYRVTGRPHPDGAVAFLFEDITSEVSLTRKFRSELMLGKHVLDGIEDGLTVFGPNGRMLLSNDAYNRIWGERSETITAAIALWESRLESAGPGFAALRTRLIHGLGEERFDQGALVGPDGGLLSWTVSSLGAGRVMVQFRPPESSLMSSTASNDVSTYKEIGTSPSAARAAVS